MGRGGGGDAHGVTERVVDANLGAHRAVSDEGSGLRVGTLDQH